MRGRKYRRQAQTRRRKCWDTDGKIREILKWKKITINKFHIFPPYQCYKYCQSLFYWFVLSCFISERMKIPFESLHLNKFFYCHLLHSHPYYFAYYIRISLLLSSLLLTLPHNFICHQLCFCYSSIFMHICVLYIVNTFHCYSIQ